MVGGQRKVIKSLQKTLRRRILSAAAIFALMASLVSGWIAFDEARELQDNLLRQVALLVDTHTFNKKLAQIEQDIDPEDALIIQALDDKGPNRLLIPPDLKDGLHTLTLNGLGWRVLVYTAQNDSSRFSISQQTDARDELAWNNSLNTLLPVLLLAPILMLIVNLALRQSIKPVSELAHTVDSRNESNLDLLPVLHVPEEIAPFIASINRLLDRLRRSISQQRRFIADAAHELRTPVTGLSLLLDNLLNTPEYDDIARRLLPIQDGITHLKILVGQLLDLARLQGESRSRLISVDLKIVIKEVIAELFPLAEGKSIDLGMPVSRSIMVDDLSGSLRMLIRNAIENAIHYTPHGGKIDVSLLLDKSQAVMIVDDSGGGIPERELTNVFEPFYRIDNNAEPGNGLGLAICHEIAVKLNGTIQLQNRTEGGLRFCYRQATANNE